MRITHLAMGAFAAWLCTGCATKQPVATPASGPPASEAERFPDRTAAPRASVETPSAQGAAVKKGRTTLKPEPPNSARKAGTPVPLKSGEEWTAEKGIAPVEAAKKIDQRLTSLSGIKVQIHYELRTAAGTGFGDPVLKIKNPKVFSFAYPTVQNGVLLGTLARADGKTVVQKLGPSVSKRSLGAKPGARTPSQVENAWLANPGHEVLTGLLEGRTPFADLVASLPKQGYALSMQKRTLRDMPNHIQFMLRAERPAAAKAGKSLIEVIVDGRLFVPMSFLVQSRKPKSATDSVFVWRASWHNKQVFDAKEFDTKVLGG